MVYTLRGDADIHVPLGVHVSSDSERGVSYFLPLAAFYHVAKTLTRSPIWFCTHETCSIYSPEGDIYTALDTEAAQAQRDRLAEAQGQRMNPGLFGETTSPQSAEHTAAEETTSPPSAEHTAAEEPEEVGPALGSNISAVPVQHPEDIHSEPAAAPKSLRKTLKKTVRSVKSFVKRRPVLE